MALFQKTIIKKYTQDLNSKKVQDAYLLFQAYFLNPTIQENIREAKEEQFQEGFLRELFGNILGYTLNPNPDFNLTTELKNTSNSKKADGAILIDNKAVAVIELKGTDTTDLAKIETQAFGYKNNQPHCMYVITSNFEKLRFYIDNTIEFIEFNLFTLNREDFNLLWLCLSLKSIEQNTPKKIKEESVSKEDTITKQLYQDYSNFKKAIFNSLVDRNKQFDKLLLFKKTQKLLDRFLFIFFAEDRLLLPANLIVSINAEWEKLQDMRVEQHLYERYKLYFNDLNTGNAKLDIYSYNGGLFAPDEILDKVAIEDALLYNHTQKLSNYDFQSEVDVNILGHIFENSLNDLDEIKAQLEGQEIDKSKTKRKKDGIFYTPKYITKYIVENTVGKLCNEKKIELAIKEEEYITDKKRQKKTKQQLADKLTEYRNWLLQLTICDPACGSGAFLNQALDFLINEHRYIDELQAKLFGDAIVLSDVENSILENNLFGVDLNEESVEIARLSLWLRTAQPNRKLNDLSNNIKCGNSLIDDPAVIGDKAFDWYAEFPQVFPRYKNKKKENVKIEVKEKADGDSIGKYSDDSHGIYNEFHEPPAPFSYNSNSKGFEKHGFDVVIGNPPYVRQELLGDYKDHFSKNYKVFNFSSDLFAYFYEKSFSLLKQNGLFGFISNTFDKTAAGIDLRKFLKSNAKFESLIDFTEIQIFEGATTYPIILIAKNNNLELQENSFSYTKIPSNANASGLDIDFFNKTSVLQNSLEDTNWTFKSNEANIVLAKIQKHKSIRETFGKCYRGIVTGFNDAFIISKIEKDIIIKESFSDEEIIKPFYEGKDLEKWNTTEIDKFIIFTKRGIEIEKYPGVKNWLSKYKSKLEPRNSPEQKEGRKAGKYKWFEIQDSVEYYKLFESDKIIWSNLQNSNRFSYEDKSYYINAPSVIFPSNNKALLAILNSKLVWYYLASICVVRSGGYIEVKPQYFEQIPIPDIDLSSNQPLTPKVNEIIELTKQQQDINVKFIRFLSSKFISININRKLENWFTLSFNDFSKELLKQKIKLTISEQEEWHTYFEEKKKSQNELENQIKKKEKEIDQMVYKLYDLTEEEIKIVEGK